MYNHYHVQLGSRREIHPQCAYDKSCKLEIGHTISYYFEIGWMHDRVRLAIFFVNLPSNNSLVSCECSGNSLGDIVFHQLNCKHTTDTMRNTIGSSRKSFSWNELALGKGNKLNNFSRQLRTQTLFDHFLL